MRQLFANGENRSYPWGICLHAAAPNRVRGFRLAQRALLSNLPKHCVFGGETIPAVHLNALIARASGENRANFAATLAEVSKGKQLILTFTPDEYSEAIASVFDPIAASNLRLVLDESEQIVSLRSR